MDGDRLAIVDEAGRPIGEELTLVLAADEVLRRTKGPVVANLATTDAVDAMAARHGCPVFRTRVGEANVAEGMRLHRAVIGGEGNGGVIWPAVNFARDSLVGMGLVLHRLAAAGRPVSALASEYDRFRVVKLQRHCPAEQGRVMLARAREAWADRPVDLTDGVKVRLEDGWFILRASNTEPIVRVIAESTTEERARAIAESVLGEIVALAGLSYRGGDETSDRSSEGGVLSVPSTVPSRESAFLPARSSEGGTAKAASGSPGPPPRHRDAVEAHDEVAGAPDPQDGLADLAGPRDLEAPPRPHGGGEARARGLRPGRVVEAGLGPASRRRPRAGEGTQRVRGRHRLRESSASISSVHVGLPQETCARAPPRRCSCTGR